MGDRRKIRFNELRDAAEEIDSQDRVGEMADTKDSLLNTYREQNEVLRKSNQDMQDRIGQLQKENDWVSSEKKNLLEKIKQLETEVVRSPCNCEDYEKLLGEFRDLQTKHC